MATDIVTHARCRCWRGKLKEGSAMADLITAERAGVMHIRKGGVVFAALG